MCVWIRLLDCYRIKMLETMQENGLFDWFSEFPYVVHIHAVIAATSVSAERSFSAFLKTYLRSI